MSVLRDVYGDLLIVRPPVPATTNKAGANYKSEVTHTEYSPRRAYDEWISILEAILEIWPAESLGVADRGIREGILRSLMARDGYLL